MLVLWQWHQITAVGEDAIIKRANEIRLMELACALAVAARGYHPVNNLQDAKHYIESYEKGIVREYNPIEEFCDEQKTCRDDYWRE